MPSGTFLCTNTSYPPIPGLPGGNVWISPEDLTNAPEHISCRPLTVWGELKAGYRVIKLLETLIP